jgi:hypothetical protein
MDPVNGAVSTHARHCQNTKGTLPAFGTEDGDAGMLEL